MASVSKLRLVGENVADTANSVSQSLERGAVRFIGWLKVANWVAGTYTIKLQHSPNGIDWYDITGGAFAAKGANGSEVLQITENLFANVRANMTVAAGPGDADIIVDLYYDKDR